MSDPETALRETMLRLAPMIGEWKGSGRGHYPTIDAFRYDETLSCVTREGEDLIRYEQRTRIGSGGSDHGDASHWEVGFVKPVGPNRLEFSSTQNGVRVEILAGNIVEIGSRIEIEVDSLLLAHDDRMVRSRRLIIVDGDVLNYEVEMATTQNPTLEQHLVAELYRVV